MIPAVGGWRVQQGVNQLTLLPPEGAARGRIVYRERVRPLRPLAVLLERHLGPVASAVRVETFVTHEGAHAVHASAVTGGVRRDLGLVFGDDFYAVLEGTFPRPADHARHGALVRALLEGDHHGLGARRRWFRYTPPPGWHGHARGLETQWYPADYPRRRATICVPPSLPGVIAPAEIVEARLQLDRASGFEPVELGAPVSLGCGEGLSAVGQTVLGRLAGGGTFVREIAVLSDGCTTYPLLFDCAGPLDERMAARQVFRAVVRSVVPLPSRRSEIPNDLSNVWSE